MMDVPQQALPEPVVSMAPTPPPSPPSAPRRALTCWPSPATSCASTPTCAASKPTTSARPKPPNWSASGAGWCLFLWSQLR